MPKHAASWIHLLIYHSQINNPNKRNIYIYICNSYGAWLYILALYVSTWSLLFAMSFNPWGRSQPHETFGPTVGEEAGISWTKYSNHTAGWSPPKWWQKVWKLQGKEFRFRNSSNLPRFAKGFCLNLPGTACHVQAPELLLYARGA